MFYREYKLWKLFAVKFSDYLHEKNKVHPLLKIISPQLFLQGTVIFTKSSYLCTFPFSNFYCTYSNEHISRSITRSIPRPNVTLMGWNHRPSIVLSWSMMFSSSFRWLIVAGSVTICFRRHGVNLAHTTPARRVCVLSDVIPLAFILHSLTTTKKSFSHHLYRPMVSKYFHLPFWPLTSFHL